MYFSPRKYKQGSKKKTQVDIPTIWANYGNHPGGKLQNGGWGSGFDTHQMAQQLI